MGISKYPFDFPTILLRYLGKYLCNDLFIHEDYSYMYIYANLFMILILAQRVTFLRIYFFK